MIENAKASVNELRQELAREEALNRLQKAADNFEKFGYVVSISITRKETETEEHK